MLLFPKVILHEIEFDYILSRVKDFAVTKSGREKIVNLKPNAEFEFYSLELNYINEFLAVYESGGSFPAMFFEELDEEWILMKIKNSVLSVEQVIKIRLLIESFNRLYDFIKKNELLHLSTKLFGEQRSNPEIPDEVNRIIDRHGQVKSSASKELAQIRVAIDKKRQASDRIFYRALKKYEKQNILAEFTETVFENKRVLAVQSSFKGQVNGMLLGGSARKSLVYVEPSECIDINNELESLIDEERREIHRILKQLTAFISGYYEFIQKASTTVIEIDFKHAKALYAYRTGCIKPSLSRGCEINILEGINPVLHHFNKEKNKKVIPLNITLNGDSRIIVISGPNAGGKSITLKTVGLFQVMVQSGLLIPANPKTKIGCFDKIMVDIGDAQSIENELSTYSSKLQKMQTFLNEADDKSLILIDEFGSGSDPELGSSLAQVFLEKLSSYGAYGVFTTHYNSIKALAAELEKVDNASMQFNKKTFQPEYVLQTGTPGSSYTFEVAQKSGIPAFIVDEARKKLESSTIQIDKLLVEVQDERIKLNRARKNLYNKVEELENAKSKHNNKIDSLEKKLSKLSELNSENSHKLMWGQRFENLVNSWLKDSSQKNRKAIYSRFMKMLKERSGEAKNEQKDNDRKEELAQNKRLQKLLKEEINLNDKVKLLINNKIGTVQEIRKNKYLILLGSNITTLLTRDQFVKVHNKKGKKE